MENKKMLDQSNYNSGCGFAEQIVSYLYGEISDSEKSNFETHLKQCPSCEGELGGFSSVRTSIQEWRAEDFASLSAPVFVPPLQEMPAEVSPSRFETVLAFFNLSPKWLTAVGGALAVIAVFAGLFWFSAIFPRDGNIAQYHEETNKESPAVPNKDVVVGPDLTATNASSDKEANKVVRPGINPKVIAKESEKSKKTVAPRGKNYGTRVETGGQNPKIKKSALAEVDKNNKTAPSRLIKNNVPPLLVEDDEDNSLRLSDIFEEVSLK